MPTMSTSPAAVDETPPEDRADDRPPLSADRSFRGLLATQLLGAFNDNVFKQAVLLIAVAYADRAGLGGGPQAAATAVFSLPFLLSCLAGVASDRYSKRTIVVGCKVLEIAIMAAATVVFASTAQASTPQFTLLLIVLFVMALQSTIFGPAKYGILPELFRESDLPRANGWMQGSTFLAIIIGTAFAGLLLENLGEQLWVLGAFCVVIAVIGTITSTRVRATPPADAAAALGVRSIWPDAVTREAAFFDRMLRRSLLVYSAFWMVGSTMTQAMNAFGVRQLGFREFTTSLLAAGLGLGIGGGCMAAARMSEGRVDFGLVRLGALGIGGCGTLVGAGPLLLPGAKAAYVVSMLGLIGLGAFAGLLAVPLQTYIQAAPPPGLKGRSVGLMNSLNAIGMVLGAGLYYVCSLAFGAERISLTFVVVGAVMASSAGLFRNHERD